MDSNLLSMITYPQDIKKMSICELNNLALELRDVIVEVVSKNGGHLASSLGTIELTLALHYVFSTPNDKIIWDVGHQAYAHKIITDRKNRFNTLRKLNGISGFTRVSESEYDTFSAGHSSTSISASLGISCAKKLKFDSSKVISIIGDGALTGGLAYEGLNQIGYGKHNENLITILNDNKMSISKSVGSLSLLLNRSLSVKKMQKITNDFNNFVKSVSNVNKNYHKILSKTENLFKDVITPGMFFGALNFEYFGPVDGHNLFHLIRVLEDIKKINKPIFLHVITKKGNGYINAEKDPVAFHGVGSFDVRTGVCLKNDNKKRTYTEVFGDTIVELALKNKKIVAITAAMSEGTGLNLFKNKFPHRFFDVGIAEQHGVTFAAGMATEGYIPIVAIYSTFLQRAYDQILHDVCLEKLSVIFAIDRSGIVGEDGATHHGLFDLSYLRNIPNMVIMAPKDEYELKNMLYTATLYGGPIAIRYPKSFVVGVDLSPDMIEIPIGKGEILFEGTEVLFLAIGNSVYESLEAAIFLKKEYGISVMVINSRFVKPLDYSLILELTKKFDNIITIEENVLDGGFGSAVLELLIDNGIKVNNFKRIGVRDVFIKHGTQKELRSKFKIDSYNIVDIVLKIMK